MIVPATCESAICTWIKSCVTIRWQVSEQILNGTSTQIGYTVHSCRYTLENMERKGLKNSHY